MDISPEAVARPQKAAGSMSAKEDGALLPSSNPHFRNVDRAPYEIGYLLRKLPANFSCYFEQPAEAYEIAEALERHASNAQGTLLSGIEAIGAALFSAANNPNGEIEQGTVARLGCLVQHLAVELQHLGELEDQCMLVQQSREKFAAAKKGGKQ